MSSCDSAPVCATCDDVTAAIPDVVIYSADAATDESLAASGEVPGTDRVAQPGAGVAASSATAGEVEAPWRLRSLSGELGAAPPVNSRSMPHLPCIAAATAACPHGWPPTDLDCGGGVNPLSRRSLSSLQSTSAARSWRDGRDGSLRPGGRSLSSVAVDTPLTSSASSAATTAGGGAGSDVSGGCAAESFDDDEPASSNRVPAPPTAVTPPTTQLYAEHETDDFPTTLTDVRNHADLSRVSPALIDDSRSSGGPLGLSLRSVRSLVVR